jgi:hypothetical protein
MKRQQRETSPRRTSSGAAALMTMFVFSAAASATVLTPGSGGQLPDVFAGCLGCTLLASHDSGFVTGSFDGVVLTVDVVAAVYSDPSNAFGAGELDFMYQVTNESRSTDSVGRITATNFAGFETDVGYTAADAKLTSVWRHMPRVDASRARYMHIFGEEAQ